MTVRKLVLIVIVFMFLSVIALVVTYLRFGNKAISSFEECAAAGYPVMYSYPAQCHAPNNRTFYKK